MLALGFTTSGVALWTTWAVVGTGVLVTSLVLGSARVYGRWRHRLTYDSREEDLPWEKLLILIEKRNRDRAAAGLPPQEATDEELDRLLAMLPALPDPRPLELPEDREFQRVGGSERRAGHRRWGNPTEVLMFSDSADQVHGIVINRSTGGLGVYADKAIQPGTFVTIRAVEAPSYVRSVLLEVRHSLKVGAGFVLGCRFSQDIPWNVRVWFG
jgi:PilZ domain